MQSRITTKQTTTAAGRDIGQYAKTVLPNGLRIVSEEIPHVRSVSVGVWIDSGSRDETVANNGISHFIEHVVFKGTEKRSVREIAQSLEAVGGYLNAFTGKEHTCFYARTLDEHAGLAIDVLSDLMLHPVFPTKELEKEKAVVIDELRHSEDDPDDIIHDYFEKALYGSHPLGFPVIGTEQNLRSFNRNELIGFRAKTYVPPRVLIAAAGRISHEHLVDLTEKYFSFAAASSNVEPARRKPTPLKGQRNVLSKPIQQAHVCMGTTSFNITNRNRYPMLVLNTLLGDGMSSRLFQNIREKYGFAYTVYSFTNLISDTGSFGTYVGTDHRHVEKSIALVWKELDKLKTRLVSKSELQRTKAQLKGSMMLSLESIPNRMIRLGSSELYFGELNSLDAITKKIDAVMPDSIQDIAQELFQEDRFSTVIFTPNGKHEATVQ
ncbi:MAG: insulinase family protein [Ignavibacteriales bacterium]|nr:insulinase family protein [Ignavibacteriales bacterium]